MLTAPPPPPPPTNEARRRGKEEEIFLAPFLVALLMEGGNVVISQGSMQGRSRSNFKQQIVREEEEGNMCARLARLLLSLSLSLLLLPRALAPKEESHCGFVLREGGTNGVWCGCNLLPPLIFPGIYCALLMVMIVLLPRCPFSPFRSVLGALLPREREETRWNKSTRTFHLINRYCLFPYSLSLSLSLSSVR